MANKKKINRMPVSKAENYVGLDRTVMRKLNRKGKFPKHINVKGRIYYDFPELQKWATQHWLKARVSHYATI